MRRLFLTSLVVIGLVDVRDAYGQALVRRGYPALSASQRETVERGEPVQILEPVPALPWPRSIVFQFIEATPEECAAVLSDYDLQSSYVPRMRGSRVIRRAGNETDVEYIIDIPVFADEKSVSRQRVSADNGEFRVQWHTVTSDTQPKGSVTTGLATFVPMKNGRSGRSGTLMVHDQTVIPASVFAKVPYVRNKAVASSRDAAKAIARQVERERAGNRDLLSTQIARLRQTLASGPDSGKVIPSHQREH
jgi:hypothetical protein